MDDIEKPLNLLDDFFKNKSSEMKKMQQKYDLVSKSACVCCTRAAFLLLLQSV